MTVLLLVKENVSLLRAHLGLLAGIVRSIVSPRSDYVPALPLVDDAGRQAVPALTLPAAHEAVCPPPVAKQPPMLLLVPVLKEVPATAVVNSPSELKANSSVSEPLNSRSDPFASPSSDDDEL